jgi:putative transposase
VSHTVSRRHTAKEIEEVLYSALANRNLKELPVEELYVVSDNAKEIRSAMEELRKIGIKHVRITPYSPWENGEIESFFSCLEREVFWRFEMESFEEAEKLMGEYVEFYNNDRIHGGIGYKTPRERYLEFVTRGCLANVSG